MAARWLKTTIPSSLFNIEFCKANQASLGVNFIPLGCNPRCIRFGLAK